MSLGEMYQSADWKTEKHVPVIEAPETVKADEVFKVDVSIGKEISHPNTTEHHIRWICLMFVPDGAKYPYEIGTFEFNAHGESVDGPNKGPVFTHHQVSAWMKTSSPGTLYASSFCNIHGLWESMAEVKLGQHSGV